MKQTSSSKTEWILTALIIATIAIVCVYFFWPRVSGRVAVTTQGQSWTLKPSACSLGMHPQNMAAFGLRLQTERGLLFLQDAGVSPGLASQIEWIGLDGRKVAFPREGCSRYQIDAGLQQGGNIYSDNYDRASGSFGIDCATESGDQLSADVQFTACKLQAI